MAPSSAARVAQLLEALGIEPSRALGQNFLVDPKVADAEAALVDLPPGSSVVEIGGGLGQLTRALLDRGFRPVTVVEKDPKLAGYLATNFEGRVRVVEGDALEVPLPRAAAYVGNLPFSVATPILERLVREGMGHGVFLVQREVAERLCAEPGGRDFGRLALLLTLEGEFRSARLVPSSAFAPEPQVEGALVVYRRGRDLPGVEDRALFEALVHGAFAHRRKMLGNTLAAALEEVPRGGAFDLGELRRLGWPEDWPRRRPEEIPSEAWIRLANALARASRGPSSAGEKRRAVLR